MTDIAVVGIDCRFPGAPDPTGLWQLLLDGGDGVAEVPSQRWDAAAHFDANGSAGTVNNKTGGFLSDADAFDHEFFGITPTEAKAMDPQQRLLLQTAWRALEDATLDPRAQAGSKTGVFVGVMANEWAHLHLRDVATITAASGVGNGYFMTANRLSYQLDFRGPSMAVDTACSSSLVAVHLAVTSLQAGECDQALAGGVNLMLTPAVNVFYTQAGLSAPDGRCKPFSAGADGIGRGEGVAVVVLRRLEDALAEQLPVYAVIKGSAVNNDGRSNGITAPSRWAQEQVIATASRAAGIPPMQVDFLETHGTGTVLGDMIEVKALAALNRGRTAPPCVIGSIKGNLGHTEGAAGIAGLIKAALSLHHRVLPPSRFADQENPALRLADSGLRMATEAVVLPDHSTAGVSSFGIGGSNCHIVVASAPPGHRDPVVDMGAAGVVSLSSNNPEGLRRNASALADTFASHAAPVAQLCWSTNRIKSSGRTRLGLVVRDRADAVSQLRAVAAATDDDFGRATGVSTGWLFNGQGTQYSQMSHALHENNAHYRTTLAQVEQAFLPHLGLPIRDVMFGAGDRIDRTEFAQPAIFAVQYALADTLIHLGVEPAWLLGHSIGEFAAAAVAGVLGLDDACLMIAARGRLMQGLQAPGTMLAVQAGVDDVADIVAQHSTLTIAAVNGPRELALSGDASAIDQAEHSLAAKGFPVRRLTVSHAFHSPLMEPVVDEFAAIAARCEFNLPDAPIFSTLRGRVLGDDEPMDADYWSEHICAPVLFADAMTAALHENPSHLLELGARRVLGPMVRRSHQDLGVPMLSTISGPAAAGTELTAAVAALYRDGLDPDWDHLYPAEAREPLRLGGYHFATSNRFWVNAPQNAERTIESPQPTQENTTMDNVIALFREQNAVLAALASGTPQANPIPTGTPVTSVAGVDPTATVRAEIARISGFSPSALQTGQTITGDLGFDSIMVTDLFTRLSRTFPQVATDRAWFGHTTTIGDVIAQLGGPATHAVCAPEQQPRQLVAPESRITEFPEFIALQERIRGVHALGVQAPYFHVNDGITRDTSLINGAEVICFSSFNYLGMSGHPRVAAAVSEAVTRYGTSCSASRVLSGEKPVHRELEAAIAELLGTEDAITLVSGHSTNVTVIGHLLNETDLVVHDSLAHDSIVGGCLLSGATRRPFPHNDFAALDNLLGQLRGQYRRVLIIIEGIYSQDGDIPDLPALIAVKKKHNALLMIDEAHSIGVLGPTGAGIGEHFGVDRSDVELWAGTTSKAFGGCGGYVAGSSELVQYLKYTAPGFVFSVGMTPPIAAASLAAIRVMRDEPEHLARLRRNAELFLALAKEAGIDTGYSSGTPVIPCIVGSSVTALRLSEALLRRGVNANPILYPAVAEDEARLRFFITSCHSEDQIRYAVKVLAEELALARA